MIDLFFNSVIDRNYTSIERFLDEGGVIDSFNKEGKTALLIATENHDSEMVSWLLNKGANVDLFNPAKNITDKTPFLFVGANGLNEILDILIPFNPDPSIVNGFGGSALIPACERGHKDTVIKLLKKTKIDVNLVNNLGWTALLEAIVLSKGGKTHQDIVKILLDNGTNPNIADKDGKTPLVHALEKNFTEIKEILENFGK